MKRLNDLAEVWYLTGERNDFSPLCLCNDVADAKWVDAATLLEMVRNDEFIPYDYLEDLFARIGNQIQIKQDYHPLSESIG